jgi:hypothetical protein
MLTPIAVFALSFAVATPKAIMAQERLVLITQALDLTSQLTNARIAVQELCDRRKTASQEEAKKLDQEIKALGDFSEGIRQRLSVNAIRMCQLEGYFAKPQPTRRDPRQKGLPPGIR